MGSPAPSEEMEGASLGELCGEMCMGAGFL